jgi:iron complex outermembrane receptor protein
VTGRINLDWDISDNAMMYFSATSGYRSGGFSLVYFSDTQAYDPEELIAYEIGYKTQWLDNTLQLNGSFYYYDYENIHTFAREVSTLPGGGTTTSILPAPGAEIKGIEAELIYYVNDAWAVGGNFSYTPSKYTETLEMMDPGRASVPESLYPEFLELTQNIKGYQLQQVPEGKATGWTSYVMNLSGGAQLELFGVYSWIDDVFYSPFESADEMAEAYDRLDLRATWSSPNSNWIASGFINNVFDDIGNLQILRQGEAEFFRHTSGTTVPRLYGLEVTYRY